MGVRVKAVAKIAERERHGRVRLNRAAYLAAIAQRRRPLLRPEAADEPRGLPLPGDLRLPTSAHDLEAARARRSSRRSAATGARSTCAYARSKNLTPVRRAHDRLDDRAGGRWRRRERRARRRGDLQPAAQPDAARDRRDAPLRAAHPADEVDHRSRSSRARTRTTRGASSGCRRRRSRTRASPRSAPRRTRRRSTTSTTCASPTTCTTSSRRAARAFDAVPRRARVRR